jgi:hypothetical protein
MAAVIVQPAAMGRRWVRVALVSALVVSCLAGAVLAVDMLNGNNPLVTSTASSAATPDHVIGDDVKTAFGVVAVEHAVAISGLDDSQVAGAHGVPGLVAAGSIDVQVAAVITNLSNDVLKYQPTQFELIDKTGTVLPVSRAAELPGELQPFAAIDVLIDFVSTADARPFKVRFTDPATKKTVLISLGNVGCTVQGGDGLPLPVSGGCNDTPKVDHTHG